MIARDLDWRTRYPRIGEGDSMKLVQELFEELETKAKAASAMGERFEMDPAQLLTLI